MPYPTRKLGRDGPEVTAIGFGLMGLSRFYGLPKPDEERFAFLDHLFASGQRFWDTADMYGDSEDLLGRWFAANPGKREQIFLATKFANLPNMQGIRSDPAYAHEAIDKSLKRLGLPFVDLYYVHRVDKVTPIEDTMEALVEMKKQGKIRYIGLSEVSAATLRRAVAVHPVAAVQVEYSPFSMDIETPAIDLLRTCRELGVGIVAYSPLGRGMLTGRYRSPADFGPGDFRVHLPRFSGDNFVHNLALVDTLAALAKEKGCTASQLTLAWLLYQDPLVVPIPGTTHIEHYDDNMGALAVELTAADNEVIRKAIAATEVAGGRYADAYTSSLYADTPEKK